MVGSMSPLAAWERLVGGPCDGEVVWAEPSCWAVVATRDSDRRNWYRHTIELDEEPPTLVAEEAHLYLRIDGQEGFSHLANGLARTYRQGQPVWELRVAP